MSSITVIIVVAVIGFILFKIIKTGAKLVLSLGFLVVLGVGALYIANDGATVFREWGFKTPTIEDVDKFVGKIADKVLEGLEEIGDSVAVSANGVSISDGNNFIGSVKVEDKKLIMRASADLNHEKTKSRINTLLTAFIVDSTIKNQVAYLMESMDDTSIQLQNGFIEVSNGRLNIEITK